MLEPLRLSPARSSHPRIDADQYTALIARQWLVDQESEAVSILGVDRVMSTPGMLDIIATTTPTNHLSSYSRDMLERAARENSLRKRDWRLVAIFPTTLTFLVEKTKMLRFDRECIPETLVEFSSNLGHTYGGFHLIDFKGRAGKNSSITSGWVPGKDCYPAHPVAMIQAMVLSNITVGGPLYQMFWFHPVTPTWQDCHMGISYDSGQALVRWIKSEDFEPARDEMVRTCLAVVPDQNF